MANDFQQRICQIQKNKANNEDLPRRMVIPNLTNRKMHFDPFYMIEFRDSQVQSRIFRMENNLKAASNEDLETLQLYLGDNVEDEYKFVQALQRQLDHKLGRRPPSQGSSSRKRRH